MDLWIAIRLARRLPYPGDVITYDDMCRLEGQRLQKGMNFKPRGTSVLLMSRRKDALYHDRIEDEGRTLVYEGHDARPEESAPDPRIIDQPVRHPDGRLTDNGKFREAALAAKAGAPPRKVHVYEKLLTSVWVFNGAFHLVDSWTESDGRREVCKFRLRLIDQDAPARDGLLEHSRVIPPEVKASVWARDRGACVKCGATANLHFDHVLPFSRGGTSLLPENVQILCAKHNLRKGDRIAD